MKNQGKSGAWRWTDDQQALFDFPRDTLVSASAGTGKTTALVELCVRLVEGHDGAEPVPLDRILAITFTNKAAAEMVERLMRKLSDRLDDPVWKHAGECWFHTFHSLGVRIISEHALELGLPPDFEVLPQEDAAVLRHETVEDVLRDALIADDPTVLRLVSAAHWKEVVQWVKNLMPLPDEETDENPSKILAKLEREFERLKNDQRERIEDIKDALASSKMSDLQRNKLTSFLHLLPGPDLFDFQDDAETGLAQFDKALDAYAQHSRWPRPIGALRKELMELLERQRSVFAEKLALPDLRRMKRLAAEARQRYAEKKRRRGGIDFDDMMSMPLKLLENHPNLRSYWQNRFDVILVDEFQDTNERQLDFVEWLSHPGDSERSATRCLYVGDRKQSIYAFRGADVSVMRGVEERFSKENSGRIVPLRDNFRSSPALIDLFNGIFPTVLSGGDEDWDVGYDHKDDLNAGRPENPEGENGPQAELNLIAFEGSAAEAREVEAREMAARIAQIVEEGLVSIPDGKGGLRPAAYGDFAILIRRNKQAPDYEQALREYEIPLSFSGSYGFSTRPEVLDAIQLLTLLVDPFDSLSAVGVARSPAIMISDPDLARLQLANEHWAVYLETPEALVSHARKIGVSEEGLQRLEIFSNVFKLLRESRYLRSVPELLESLIERSDLLLLSSSGSEGTRARANLRRLLDRTWAFHLRNPGLSPEAFLRLWKRDLEFQSRDAEASPDLSTDAVKLMTVHQAKGLEFPIVILPGLAQHPPFRGGRVFRTDDQEAGVQYYAGGGRFEKTYSYFRSLKLQALKSQAEEMRLFYVALTRAKEYLVFSATRTAKQLDKGPSSELDIRHWLDSVWRYAEDSDEILLQKHEEAKSYSPIKIEDFTEPPWRVGSSEPPFVPLGMGTISISRLSMHDRCPRRFHLQRRIDRSAGLWHGISREDSLPVTDTGSQRQGLLLHNALERLSLDRIPSGDEVENLLKTFGDFEGEGFFDRVKILGALFRSEWMAGVCSRMETGTKALREVSILTRFDFPSGRFVRLKGVLDLLLIHPDGTREIVEFKSGKPRKIHEFQCKTYACAIRQADSRMKVEARLVYLGNDPEVRELRMGNASCRSIKAEWEKRLQGIEEEKSAGWESWRHMPETTCRNDACSFLEVCYPPVKEFDPLKEWF